MTEAKRNLGIRATEDRWEALKQLAIKRRTSVQGLVDTAIDACLLQPVAARDESTYLDALRDLLASPEDPKRDKVLSLLGNHLVKMGRKKPEYEPHEETTEHRPGDHRDAPARPRKTG